MGKKLWNKRNNQTKDGRRVWAFFVYSDQRNHDHRLKLFLSYEKFSFFFFFSFFLFKFSVKTKHAAYLVYAVTLKGEEKDKQKMAATSHGSRRGAGTTESASI